MPSTLTVGATSTNDDYLTRLIKQIPTTAIGLYVFGSNVIPGGQSIALLVWSLFCLAVVLTLTCRITRDSSRGKRRDWGHASISAFSFVLWLYVLGGPFTLYHLAVPWLASLLVAMWTTLVPLIYKKSIEPQVRSSLLP